VGESVSRVVSHGAESEGKGKNVKIPHDDFTGTAVPTREVPLSLDGEPFTLDLSEDTLTALKSVCSQDGRGPALMKALYVKSRPVAVKSGIAAITAGETPAITAGDNHPVFTEPVPVTVDQEEVRAWAKKQPQFRGKIKDRGRLASHVVAAFVAAR
jgi:hypothetical protein